MLIGCNLLNIFSRNIIKLVIPKFWSAFLMSLTFENIVEFLKQHIKCVRYTALRKVGIWITGRWNCTLNWLWLHIWLNLSHMWSSESHKCTVLVPCDTYISQYKSVYMWMSGIIYDIMILDYSCCEPGKLI